MRVLCDIRMQMLFALNAFLLRKSRYSVTRDDNRSANVYCNMQPGHLSLTSARKFSADPGEILFNSTWSNNYSNTLRKTVSGIPKKCYRILQIQLCTIWNTYTTRVFRISFIHSKKKFAKLKFDTNSN